MNVSKYTRFRCFFEQSGTFKNEFKKLGFEAYDYDIANDFGETDVVCDLFESINLAYEGRDSIFSNFHKDLDFIIAFFPCICFSKRRQFDFKGNAGHMKKWTTSMKLLKSMEVEQQRSYYYSVLCKLFIVCDSLHLRLIVENPYSPEHYLTRYFCIEPGFIDMNRRDRGDWFEKPTQFFFLNCKPADNFILEAIRYYEHRRVLDCPKVERSSISPDYANRFIREFIL